MTTLAPTAAVCDRGDCPAPAQRTVRLHGQDFYFCSHHAAEMQGAFAVVAAQQAPLADAQHADQVVVLAWRGDVVPDWVPADEW